MKNITARQAKNLVDKIGIARAVLTESRQDLLKLEAQLIAYSDRTGELLVPGSTFQCRVIHSERNTVSWKSVADEAAVAKWIIDKYTSHSSNTRVDTRAFKSDPIDDK